MKCSEGWLQIIKSMWGLRSHKLHGERGDVNEQNFNQEANAIREKIEHCYLNDVSHCNESDLFYQRAPSRTIVPTSFAGKKIQKPKLTFLSCCKATSTKNIPLMLISGMLKNSVASKRKLVAISLFTPYITRRRR